VLLNSKKNKIKEPPRDEIKMMDHPSLIKHQLRTGGRQLALGQK